MAIYVVYTIFKYLRTKLMFKIILKATIILALWSFALDTNATASWYTGKVNRIWPNGADGTFIITFKSTSGAPSSLDDCKHNYAYFRASTIPLEQHKKLLSLALSAFHTDSTVGIVIDKTLNGEYCYAISLDIRK